MAIIESFSTENTLNPAESLGVAAEVDITRYASLVDLFQSAVDHFAEKPAYTCLDHTISYRELGELAGNFAAYLQQQTSLQPGDRIAIQLPNILQYPVALYGAMMAGLVVVNTNPLYSYRELEHQLNDSGAKAVVVLANFADTLERIIANTGVEQVIITELADLHPAPKRWLINGVVKHIKKMVPKTHFPESIRLRQLLLEGSRHSYRPYCPEAEQTAVLQYTGGTTGVAKAAMLCHRNLVANILQCMEVFKTYRLRDGEETLVMPLPLYHIYSFTVGMILLSNGNHIVLVPDPRDITGLIKTAVKYRMSVFCGINTLFVAMCRHSKFKTIDFSNVRLVLSGGMALTLDAAEQWHKVSGTEIYQGYGLTETSPVVTVNYGGANKPGSIGYTVPSTELKIIDADGKAVALGEIGELCVRGPQVMKGYWRNEAETAKVLSPEGWFKTGDMARCDEQGFYHIVDRIKDMVIVSGFNVYPNEVEDVVSQHPLVRECAVIGVPDTRAGEKVKLYVVREDETLTEQDLKAYCRQQLTAYKVPKIIEFREDLPKSNVGKVLRKVLREELQSQSAS
jgi:long-chain acyl-CoA synthetase